MEKYRTSLIFNWVDLFGKLIEIYLFLIDYLLIYKYLTVAFGGIAALCLGFSLLSFAELVFFLYLAIVKYFRKLRGNLYCDLKVFNRKVRY